MKTVGKKSGPAVTSAETPSQTALRVWGADPGMENDETAEAINQAVAYIHSKPREQWDESDQAVDDLEVESRPGTAETGWWKNDPKA